MDAERVRFHHTAKTAHKAHAKHPAKAAAHTSRPATKSASKPKPKAKSGPPKQKARNHAKVTRYGAKATAKPSTSGATKPAHKAKAAHHPHNGTAHHEQYKTAPTPGSKGGRP